MTTGYVLHGSVREAGDTVRVTMQLSDALSGTSVWADTYDRSLEHTNTDASRTGAQSIFEIQDDLTATIVATIGDTNGALVRSMTSAVRDKPIEALTPYEAVLRRFAYLGIMSPAEHALVRTALERAVERAPRYAGAWAALAQIYVDEYSQPFNPRPNPLERARAAAEKAIEADASSQSAQVALAMVGYFTRDISLFRAAAERALELNPFDTATMSLMGTFRTYLGDREGGMALSRRARALNPHHPGIYWVSEIVDHYARGDYEGALSILNRVNMPAYPNTLVMRAAIYAQLGRLDEGRAQLAEAEARMPGISERHHAARQRWLCNRELEQKVQDGLDKLQLRTKD